MTTNITRFFRLSLGPLGLVCWGLLALSLSPVQAGGDKPRIRKETIKRYEWQNDSLVLCLHTETEYNIGGKVVQFAEYGDARRGQLGELYRLKIHKYNSEGQFLGLMSYDSASVLVYAENYRLDEQGQVLEKITEDYSQYPPKQHSWSFSYNEKGKQIGIKRFEDGLQVSERHNVYNTEGELVESYEWAYNPDVRERGNKPGKTIVRTDNQYDAQGYLVKSVAEHQMGKRKWREERLFRSNFLITYNRYEEGKRVSHFALPARDTSRLYEEYHFEEPQPYPGLNEFNFEPPLPKDPLANIPHTVFREVSYKHDERGLCLRKTIREHEMVVHVTHYTYNEQGLLIEERREDRQKLQDEELRFEYDAHQNLLKESLWRNGLKVHERYFLYEYY